MDELSHADRAWKACGCGESVRETIEEDIRTYKCEEEGKTKMAFIIAIAIYDGGIDVAVPTFLLGLVVWYGSFLHQVMRTLTIYWESKPLASGYK